MQAKKKIKIIIPSMISRRRHKIARVKSRKSLNIKRPKIGGVK